MRKFGGGRGKGRVRRGQRKAGMGERPGKGQSAETALAGDFGLDVKKRVKALFTGYGSIFRLILGLCGGAALPRQKGRGGPFV